MDDLRLLRVLREVALRGSFSEAAEALSYTQPAVSQQVARLERQVGLRLIERERRQIKLTPAGQVLVRHVERVLAELAEAEAELADLAGDVPGRLCVGAYPSAAGTILPPAVSAFRGRLPSIPVSITIAEPPDLLAAVRRAECDLVIVDDSGFTGELALRGLRTEPLLEDPMYLALPADHRLSQCPSVALTELRDEDWILVGMPGLGDRGSNVILRACREVGFQPRVVFASVEYYAIQGLIATGMGVALLPALALATLRADIVVRPIDGRPPVRRISAATVAGTSTGMVDRMIDLLKEASRAYTSSYETQIYWSRARRPGRDGTP